MSNIAVFIILKILFIISTNPSNGFEYSVNKDYFDSTKLIPFNDAKILFRWARNAPSELRGHIGEDRFRNNLHKEYTNDGVIFKGGRDLPKEFRGSGTSDFAFEGPSFRSSRIPLVEDSENFDNKNTQKNPKNSKDGQNRLDKNRPQSNNAQRPFRTESGPQNWQNQNDPWPEMNPPQINNQENDNQYPPEKPNPCQLKCHRNMMTTEYNPVCGSDGITYYNPSKFRCATTCGRRITGRPYTSCGFGAPVI